jgi:hypothetical protein
MDYFRIARTWDGGATQAEQAVFTTFVERAVGYSETTLRVKQGRCRGRVVDVFVAGKEGLRDVLFVYSDGRARLAFPEYAAHGLAEPSDERIDSVNALLNTT